MVKIYWEKFNTWISGPRCGINNCPVRVWPRNHAQHFYHYHRDV